MSDMARRRLLGAATAAGVAGLALGGSPAHAAGPAGRGRPATVPNPVWRTIGAPLARGARSGPLAHRTVAVKDLFAVAGERIGAGNPFWLEQAPVERRHAAAVQRLLSAGADVTGLAATDELAYSLAGINIHYGTPRNPAAPGRVPGGSSSGPASAVAQRLADIGLGTDTGGSVRVPASNCGLYGIRTTHGLVSRDGLLPLAQSFDTVGWFTRDAALFGAVARVFLPAAAPVRRLIVPADLLALAEPATAAAVRAAALALAGDKGLTVTEPDRTFGADLADWANAFRIVQSSEAWANHGAWIEANPGVLAAEIHARFAGGAAVTAQELRDARATIEKARARVRALVPEGTALALPAASAPAVPLGGSAAEVDAVRGATLRLTCAAGVSGLPCAVFPGPKADGLPVGLALIGAPNTDRSLTALAD
ncbi:amidase [Actinomadura rugatobispora]|uniref:Amidase n=1 Tax=Actinomadura rugatobispora TaxID=1994 RepID=A0ABW0ZQW7_9ACTN|nr:amidase [Actinomadura rugatobispora]